MNKSKLTFSVKKEDGGYTAQCLEFPGIITEGNTKRELMEMINDAVDGYFEAFPDEKEKLPSVQKTEVITISV
jgi:predicted RNase H-like HicB family nuclease